MKATIDIDGGSTFTVDLADFSSLRYFNIEFTSTCNLKCTYCPVSNTDWKGEDASDRTIGVCSAIAAGRTSVRVARDLMLGCTSVGEITTMRNWMAAVEPFLTSASSDARVSILSNLQKILSDEEIDAFARFDLVSFSLDTVDRHTLGLVRRKSNLGNITMNLMRIRARSIELRKRQPFVTLNCVVSDLNALQLLQLASFAIACGVNRLYLIDLLEMPIDDPSITRPPRHVTALDADGRRAFVEQVQQARALLAAHRCSLSMTGDLEATLRAFTEGRDAAPHLPEGQTRICTQLWDTLFVKSDGRVTHCCGELDSGARIESDAADGVVNNATIREWRNSLLTGRDLPKACQNCNWARAGGVRELRERVARLHAAAASREQAALPAAG